MTRLTATEIARNFSDVLNRVASGEQIEITRSGAPIAVLGPLKSQVVPYSRLRELIAAAPPVDEDFAADVRALRESVGPPGEPWPS
ncbi:MAG: type II toxin-antitoxin system prevent-host-death family antitoxin [Solirubrobacterales bacterium]